MSTRVPDIFKKQFFKAEEYTNSLFTSSIPSIKKVRNWNDYNKALRKMGEIILSFDENYLAKLYFCGKQKCGEVKEYTDKMYEFLLTVKVTLIQCNKLY